MEQEKTFVKKWGALVAFGVCVLAGLLGFRYWTEYRAGQPVYGEYGRYLQRLASASASAKTYLLAHIDKYRRDTVASAHFEHVCGVMTHLALADGVNPNQYSSEIAGACRIVADRYPRNDLP